MKIKQLGITMLSLILCLGLFAGCSKEPGVIETEYDLATNIVYYAPVQDGKGIDEYGFEATFYKFCLGDPVYADRMDGHVFYYAGDDAVLTGTNVEALDGASIEIGYYDYDKVWDDKEDYKAMREADFRTMFKDEYSNDAELEDAVKAATDLAMEYYPKTQCLRANLVFKGPLTENVKIEKIEIPSIDFAIEIDSFEVKTFELPEDVIPCFNEVSQNLPATLNGYGIGGTPYYTEGYNTAVMLSDESDIVRGIANTEIIGIEAVPLTEFLHISGKNGDTHFKKGEEFLLNYKYGFDDEAIEGVASVCGSVVLKVKTIDDKEYWYFDTMKIGVNEYHLMPTFVRAQMQ
ncbi:MAG: hypothetical protein IKT62_01665 [Firmicutes bacterium]|nr:hypothetical protein [Bacillota bacterium]